VKCFTAVARGHPVRTRILLDAGILSLLLRILPEELHDPSILPSTPAALDEFLETVHNRGLIGLLKAEPLISAPKRNILVNAFCVFYGSPDEIVEDHPFQSFDVPPPLSYSNTMAALSALSLQSEISVSSQLTSTTLIAQESVTSTAFDTQDVVTPQIRDHTTSIRSRNALIRVRMFTSALLRRRNRRDSL
jgi:hypothetical protein